MEIYRQHLAFFPWQEIYIRWYFDSRFGGRGSARADRIKGRAVFGPRDGCSTGPAGH